MKTAATAFFLAGCVAALLAGCVAAPPPVDPDAPWTPTELARLRSMRLDVTPRPDPTDRVADDATAAAFGQKLYYDAGLSPGGAVSCATCHQPDKHFTDGLTVAHGVADAARHTPSIIGSQWGPYLFWDGRADSLWMQALGPLENPREMGSDRLFVAHRVADEHASAYEAVFGLLPVDLDELPERGFPDSTSPELLESWTSLTPSQQDGINRVFSNVGKAVEAYERELVPGEAPFDRYVDAVTRGDLAGGGTLDEAQIRGLRLFVRDGGCVNCHNGPMLTDRAFHNLGLPEPGGGYDSGRSMGAMELVASTFNCKGPYSDSSDCPELRYLNPTFPDFVSAFKTPSLRNVAETAPYTHSGLMPDLASVLDFYSNLPGVPMAGHRELTLKPLHLAPDQRDDLIAFLGALTGDPLPPELLRP